MEFTPETKIKDILETYPELKDKLPEVNEKLSIVKTAVGRAMIGKYTIADAEEKTGIPAEKLIEKLKELLGIN